ncbi:MAG: hypothetical protein D6696_17870 [Acidobacteria bacterium]|nr:MAG: hypothetical protein D6696_17870 [Acidobacteriota bacterium]
MGESGEPAAGGGDWRRWRWLPLAAAALACLGFALGELRPPLGELGLPLDDSWIHLHFARQIAAGEGLSYNPGRWISGSTSPLWTALLALCFLLPGPVLVWVKLLGALFFLATVDATHRLGRALGLGDALALLAAGLVATTYWLVWSALSGMEVALFAALSLWGMRLQVDERRTPGAPPAGLALLAIAALARPEGYLLLALAAADRLVLWRRTAAGVLRLRLGDLRSLAEGLVLVALVLAPTLAFYRAVGGSVLPTTFAVKASPPAGPWPDGRYLRVVADVLFRSQPIALLAAGAGVARLSAVLGTERDRGLLPALWLAGLPLAYATITPSNGVPAVGNFGRYYFPLLPVVALLGLHGLAAAGRQLPRWLELAGRRLALAAVAAALLLLPQLWGVIAGRPHYLTTIANVQQSDVAAARWLAPRLPPQARLAVQDAGALKFFLPNEILDLAGIVTPEILPFLHGSAAAEETYWEDRLLAFLSATQPDYLVVFPASYPKLTSRVPGFVALKSFAVENNVTMAGDRLVVFATPWNRHPLRPAPPRRP